MPEPFPASKLLAALGRALDRARLGYVVIGGQAILRYGRARLTDDVDVTLLLPPYTPRPLVDLLPTLGLTPKFPEALQRVRMSALLPCLHPPSALGVDFALADSDYERLVVRRAEVEVIDGVPVRFASAEDLLIQKTLAARDVDRGDVRWLLSRQDRLDLAYVRDWLHQFEALYERPLVDEFDAVARSVPRV